MKFSRILAAVLVIAATLWIGSGVFGRTETEGCEGQGGHARRLRSRCSRSP